MLIDKDIALVSSGLDRSKLMIALENYSIDRTVFLEISTFLTIHNPTNPIFVLIYYF